MKVVLMKRDVVNWTVVLVVPAGVSEHKVELKFVTITVFEDVSARCVTVTMEVGKAT